MAASPVITAIASLPNYRRNLKNRRMTNGKKLCGLLLVIWISSRAAFGMGTPAFQKAQPIWPQGRETEKNLFVGFRTFYKAKSAQNVTLRVTGSTLYRIFLNGRFVGHGPARGAHGYFRVDEWDLKKFGNRGTNVLAIEVAGYNANSYYLLNQPSFLQAEVVSGTNVLAFTGGTNGTFYTQLLPERVQKVQRYSFQRPFSEIYRLSQGFDSWHINTRVPIVDVKCAAQEPKKLLPRRVPYPDFLTRPPVTILSAGKITTNQMLSHPWKDRSLTAIGPNLAGFPEQELSEIPSLELQTIANGSTNPLSKSYDSEARMILRDRSYAILDFGTNLTGFIGAQIVCHTNTRVAFTFDEILSNNNDVDFKRLGCVNIVVYELEPGTYSVETFEPYTLRYLKAITLAGDCTISGVYLRELVNPSVKQAQFVSSDDRLNRLFAAGRETFRQNATDIFMDCPSRERAGWLCDSFFTSRVAYDLCGDTKIEKNFFENFQLPEKFAHLPDGMLPMCYPADHNDGVFIPNWSLWFVVQLEEYLARSGDRELVDALRPRVLKLLDYFKQFRNEDGLLEKLQSWVFVEWSKANELVQDVNYPSNMLYAKALAAAGEMYQMPELSREADKLRDTIRRQSFDGEFFVDNAIRKEGKLQVTRNRSEVNQYFAFYFDVATPESHPKLWEALTKDFGPQRKQTKGYPEVHFANSFVGNVLRLELLSRYGRAQQNLNESIAYLLYMAERTGTLWENDGAYASCNHGFASHIVHVLYRDVLGIANIDPAHKVVKLRFSDLKLERCQGTLPTADGLVTITWRKVDGKLFYKTTVPKGYKVQVINDTGHDVLAER